MTPALLDMILRLRSKGISDTNLLRAMETIPRARFVSDRLNHKAYDETALPIGCGQSTPEPWLVAAMTQAAELTADHKVLHIGTGSGYHAAILGRLSRRTYSVDRYKELVDQALPIIRDCGVHNVVLRQSDGAYGWRGQAPFDRIIVMAGLTKPPGRLFGQLVNGGKLAAVLKGQLTVYSKNDDEVQARPLFAANLPPLIAGKSKAL